ncbi:Flp family type IVb pilin [Paraburkholderia sp. J67]|uniref:Flp family type IVb pilin n=1 Tax=Paraburkholderia sp. J67 TaxID=2805435 RepID=UPI002ABE93FC|nr:Flp family type IVb pilin [Paraburkholderia sp. J67]
MKKLAMHFWKSEDGVTALEYGLIAGLIAVVIAATVSGLGTKLNEVFFYISSQIGTVP